MLTFKSMNMHKGTDKMSCANTCMLANYNVCRDLEIAHKNFNKVKKKDKDDRYTSIK